MRHAEREPDRHGRIDGVASALLTAPCVPTATAGSELLGRAAAAVTGSDATGSGALALAAPLGPDAGEVPAGVEL